MRQSPVARIGTKLRSLLWRVMRRCGLDMKQAKRPRRRNKRQAFAGVQPLESRQLLSVAIEMVVNTAETSAVYVQDGSTINASLGDSFTVDFYITSDEGTPNNTLFGFDLNFGGTDASISLDEWLRNTTLFPNTAGDVVNFSDDAVDDGFVNAATVGLDDRSTGDMTSSGGVTGWLIGSLDITLPSEAGDYILTFDTDAADRPTLVTHTGVGQDTSDPTETSLTFHLVEAATVSIETLPALTNDVAGNFSTIDITTTNVDAAEFTLSDLQLERGGSILISDTDGNTDNDWEDFPAVSLVNAGGGVFQVTGLDTVIDDADGDFIFTVIAAGVLNNAGIPLLASETATFSVDTQPPQVTLDTQTTSDSTPTLTGTVTDLNLDTMSITVTHADDGSFASQMFTLANGDFTIDGSGNWTLDGSKLTALEGGLYDVRIIAVDDVSQTTDTTFSDALLITDIYEDAGGDDVYTNAVALAGARQYNLSIHEAADEDWKSLTIASSSDVLFLGSVVSGSEMTINVFLDDGSVSGTPDFTFTSSSGVLNQTQALSTGTYYIQIVAVGGGEIYNYNFIAGVESELSNTVSGTVFVDDDFNGIEDDGQGGWNGLTVQLLNTSDSVIDTTATDVNGDYTFSNVISDTYRVRIVLPDGTFQTSSNPADFLLDGAVDQTGVDFGVRNVEVTDEYIFYNESIFDGDNAAANSDDDNAIDTGKSALYGGQTATISNYTTGQEGINGIMIDVIGLPVSSLDVTDFTFKVGNDSTPDDWTTAPTPTSITVREGEGVNGTDRVTIIWDDGEIQDQWLQVTVLAAGDTNVAADHVFYFGSAIGDTSGDGFTSITDVFQIWGNRVDQGIDDPVGPDYIYDMNHDSYVSISDVFIAWANRKSQGIDEGLSFITPPASLMLTGSVDEPSTQVITLADIQAVQSEALAYWQQQDITEAQWQLLTGVQVQIGDLAGNQLGQTQGNLITLDINAAGAGWFIDQSPADSAEFILTGDQWIAEDSSDAFGKVDLLTVLAHEYGHVLGHADESISDADHGLLDAALATGTRRLSLKPILEHNNSVSNDLDQVITGNYVLEYLDESVD